MPISIRHEGDIGQALKLTYQGARGVEARKERQSALDRDLRRDLTYAGIRSQRQGQREAGEQQAMRDAMRYGAALEEQQMELQAKQLQDQQDYQREKDKAQFRHELDVKLDSARLSNRARMRVETLNKDLDMIDQLDNIDEPTKEHARQQKIFEVMGILDSALPRLSLEKQIESEEVKEILDDGTIVYKTRDRNEKLHYDFHTPKQDDIPSYRERISDATKEIGKIGDRSPYIHEAEAWANVGEAQDAGVEPNPEDVAVLDEIKRAKEQADYRDRTEAHVKFMDTLAKRYGDKVGKDGESVRRSNKELKELAKADGYVISDPPQPPIEPIDPRYAEVKPPHKDIYPILGVDENGQQIELGVTRENPVQLPADISKMDPKLIHQGKIYQNVNGLLFVFNGVNFDEIDPIPPFAVQIPTPTMF